MKNFTLRSLYLTLAVVLFSALPRTMNAQVNCATFTTAGTPAVLNPTSTFQTVTTQSGRYYSFTATAGCTYTFSHCQGGGGIPVGTDPALTLTDASNVSLVFNDDGVACQGGSGSEIVWTCPANGTYRIHHEKCCCSQAGSPNFATMAFKVECPCVSGTAFAAPSPVCVGATTTLTLSGNSPGSGLQWQSSTDNVNFVNISGANFTPYTTGPLSVTSYFRAVVSCSGVGNTVGNDTTVSVQVVVSALPTVIFPPQASPACCNSAPITLNSATPVGGTYSGTGVTGTGPYTFTPNVVCNGTSTITYTYTDGNGCTNTATQPYAVNDTPAVTFPPLTPVCYANTNFPLNTATPPGGTYSGGTYVVGNNFIIPAPGVYPVTYTYTSGGCTSQAVSQQTIWSNPLITISPVAAQCNQNTNCVPLTATPVGGTWSGSIYINGNTFCPLSAPQGNQTITYTYTDGNGCTSVSNANVLVEVAPNITWNSAFPTVCENNNLVNLNGYAQPGGGTYSGIGVNANQFNPAGQCANSPINITYTATTTSGCLSTSSQPIIINCIPTVTFTGPVPPICVGSAPVNLAPYVSPAGGQFSGTTLVTTAGIFTPTTVGNYNITYQYLDLSTNCSNSTTFQVQVVALPNVNIPFLEYPDVCQGSGNILLNGSGTPLGGVYTGTGVILIGTNYYFSPVLAGADTFMIHYVYTTTGGCGGEDSASIIVHPSPVINFPAIADVCDDDALVQLLATPVGGTFIGTNVNFINPNYYFNPGTATPGNYTITYNYTDGVTTCASSATQNIIVKPRPGAITISNIVNPTSCGANNGSYRINGLTPNTNYILYYEKNSVLQGPFSIVSSNLGTYTVTNMSAATYANVYVYLNGCAELVPPAPFNLVDPNAPAAPTAGSNSPLCQYSTLQLTATSGVVNGSYTWAGPNSFGSNQQNPVIFNAGTAASGNYTVTVTNNLNCTSLPTTIAVVVNPAPALTISSNAPICAGNTLTLTASSTTVGTSFAWDGPAGFFAPTAIANRPNMAPVHQGWYHAVATGPNGCTRIDSVLVNVGTVTPITPTAGANTPVCSGTNLNLTATNSTPGATYQWYGPTTFSSTLQNPVRPNVQVADSGDYTVQAFLNGCNSGISTINVQVIQSITPDIIIAANPDDTVCFGTNIDFTSVITDGGTSPQYQWYKNGIPVIGAIDSLWGSPYLTNLDTIYCVLINGTTCTTAAADTSNKIAVHMSPNQIPTVTVGSYPFAWVLGQNMTYYANVLNAGTNPTYQWYLNGNILVGETGATYSSNALISTDVLSVTVTSNAPCAIPNTANGDWNAILSLSVNTAGQVVDDLKLYPNPNNGTFNVSGSFGDMTGVKDGSVEVLNAVGQVVFKESTTINNGKIDKQVRISDIAAGVYIIRVSADGKTSQLRFVVTK
jgi:hypothetical protein